MRPHNDPDVLSQALAEPSRRALLENLRYGQKTVTQLVEATTLKQPNVSNHLAKMKQQGIVRAERMGRQVYYSLSAPFADVLMRMHEIAANPVVEIAAPLQSPLKVISNDKAGQSTQKEQASFHALIGSAPAHSPREGEYHAPRPSAEEDSGASADFLHPYRDAYFRAMMAGDEEQAVTLVNALVAQRLPLETIYTEVFAKSINDIGELYRQGITDEAHEHMASAIMERMMARVAQFYTPVARVSCRALLGCVAGNWHMLGLRMLADGLKTLGWETIFLGANVPTVSFISMAQAVKPDLVIVSCAMQEQAEAAHDLLTQLALIRQKEVQSPFQIAAGGHYFLEHAEGITRLPIDFTAADLRQFLDQIKYRFPEQPVA